MGVSIDAIQSGPADGRGPRALRPAVMGTRHVVAAGHPLAAQAALQILEAGGNAVDAGCAAGIALGVVHSDMVSFAGVAPIMISLARTRELITIDGVGRWPRRATAQYFRECWGGEIPAGLPRTVIPAAPDAWLTALDRFGTMGFREVAAAAIRFAREGFPLSEFSARIIGSYEAAYRRWPSSAAIYLPGGRPPESGDRFVQADLGRMLQYLADEEQAAASRGRAAGLQAAREAFYRGDVARAIAAYHAEHGGLLAREDLADYRVSLEPPCRATFRDLEVATCGFFCQGPVLLQTLNLLEPIDLAALGHGSPGYLHLLVEALKLAYADREAYYGDPDFVPVPARGLLAKSYADARRALLNQGKAWPEMPPPGDPEAGLAVKNGWSGPVGARNGPAAPPLDTSYVAVVDAEGNAFSATPSDVSTDTPIIPGTGLAVSSRGSQSWLDPDHPSVVAPGKRPRLTPNPAMAFRDGRLFMAFGTPGGDIQCQAMLQAFLNIAVFGMPPQEAVEAPRVATVSFPGSFWPHLYLPGRLRAEARIPPETLGELERLGHRVERWSEWEWRAGAVCLVSVDAAGVRHGAADPRRASYAVGW